MKALKQAAGQGKGDIVRRLCRTLIIRGWRHEPDSAAVLAAADFREAVDGFIHAHFKQLERLASVQR